MHPHSEAADTLPFAVVVMGVSGSGKSTLGIVLADRLGCDFLEGDDFHPAENVAKMSAGHPLTDADRWPWLDRVAVAIKASAGRRGTAVAACSALKHAYRERLSRSAGIPILFVFLDTADRDELARRLVERSAHYMPASLLASQLAALEKPADDEPAITLDARDPPDRLRDKALAWIRTTAPARLPAARG